MTARDIMSHDVPTVSMDTPVVEAVRLLHNRRDEGQANATPGLIVLNERQELAGIFSPLSVMKALLDEAGDTAKPLDSAFYDNLCAGIKEKRVAEVMDWQPISVTEDALLLDIADLFVKHRFQRIPVVTGKQVAGIIYRSRIMEAMTRCLAD